MTKQAITQEYALQVIEYGESDNMPFRVINTAGMRAVREFVKAHAKDPDGHNIYVWCDDAEKAANDATPGETIIIEMSGAHSITGNPVTLRMDDDHFHWFMQS